jgi:hypothetical protein
MRMLKMLEAVEMNHAASKKKLEMGHVQLA